MVGADVVCRKIEEKYMRSDHGKDDDNNHHRPYVYRCVVFGG